MLASFLLKPLMKEDKLVKSQFEADRWLDKKFDICPEGNAPGVQGVVFLADPRLYMWYVEGSPKTYNEGDRAFYDTIKQQRG